MVEKFYSFDAHRKKPPVLLGSFLVLHVSH